MEERLRGHRNPLTTMNVYTRFRGNWLTISQIKFPTDLLILRCVASREISNFVSTTPNNLTTPKSLGPNSRLPLWEASVVTVVLCGRMTRRSVFLGRCESDCNTPCSFRNHHRRSSSVLPFIQWLLCVYNDADIAETSLWLLCCWIWQRRRQLWKRAHCDTVETKLCTVARCNVQVKFICKDGWPQREKVTFSETKRNSRQVSTQMLRKL